MKNKVHVFRETVVEDIPDHFIISWIHHVMRQVEQHEYDIDVLIVDEEQGAMFNSRYRNKYGATNVLSFDTFSSGQIILCAPVIIKEAHTLKKDPSKYWAFMLIHGTLHLCGYDHEDPKDAVLMESMEDTLLQDYPLQ